MRIFGFGGKTPASSDAERFAIPDRRPPECPSYLFPDRPASPGPAETVPIPASVTVPAASALTPPSPASTADPGAAAGQAGVPQDAVAAAKRQLRTEGFVRSTAGLFFFIAGATIVNFAMLVSNSAVRWGLGMLAPRAMVVLFRSMGPSVVVLSGFVAIVGAALFAIVGAFTLRQRRSALVLGLVLVVADALFYFVIPDMLAILMHAFAVFSIIGARQAFAPDALPVTVAPVRPVRGVVSSVFGAALVAVAIVMGTVGIGVVVFQFLIGPASAIIVAWGGLLVGGGVVLFWLGVRSLRTSRVHLAPGPSHAQA